MANIIFKGGWNGNGGNPELSSQSYYEGEVVIYQLITYIVKVPIISIGSPTPENDFDTLHWITRCQLTLWRQLAW